MRKRPHVTHAGSGICASKRRERKVFNVLLAYIPVSNHCTLGLPVWTKPMTTKRIRDGSMMMNLLSNSIQVS
jgi:hypothetical protein